MTNIELEYPSSSFSKSWKSIAKCFPSPSSNSLENLQIWCFALASAQASHLTVVISLIRTPWELLTRCSNDCGLGWPSRRYYISTSTLCSFLLIHVLNLFLLVKNAALFMSSGIYFRMNWSCFLRMEHKVDSSEYLSRVVFDLLSQ